MHLATSLIMTAALVFASVASAATTVNTALTHSQVLSGLEIQFEHNQVTVLPGVCRIGATTVKVDQPATFTVDPAEQIHVTDESYELTTDIPDRWIKGTHLKGCISTGGTAIPGCLIPGSVAVKLSDGTLAKENVDYRIDTRWAALSRIPTGRIGAKSLVSYRIGQMRLDSLMIARSGKVTLARGKPERTTPEPPALPDDSLRLANIFMPPGAASLAAPQILVIGDPFPAPAENLLAIRTTMVSKTLRKLRRGEPVTLVAWGDSVTAGGDASSPELAFPRLFTTRLGERFKKAKVTLVNAGIGGSNTAGRLPHLYKEVLAYNPDLVTIEFVNDMQLPEAAVRENLEAAFLQIRGSGAEIILITPHFTLPELMGRAGSAPSATPWHRARETRRMVDVLREISDDKSVGLADVSRRWEHLEKQGLPYHTLLENGINHPDDRGHALFVEELLTFFPLE